MEQIKKDRLITIKNCNSILLDGVNHIIGFDEKCIILSCDFGRVVIEGDALKVDSLLKETGEISIVGKFAGLYFSEEKHKENILKQIFK